MVLSICEMLGPQGVLCGKNKDLTGKIIVSASQFLTDASQEVRFDARILLQTFSLFEFFLCKFRKNCWNLSFVKARRRDWV